MQRRILIAVIIIIPLLISLFASWLILNRSKKSNSPSQLSQFPTATPTPPDIISGLVFPAFDASSVEKDRFYDAALKKAQRTTEITLSSCNASPPIIKVAPNTQVTINNTDAKERTIAVGRTQKYTVPAKGRVRFAANFDENIGTYGFSCDNGAISTGIIVLTNNQE